MIQGEKCMKFAKMTKTQLQETFKLQELANAAKEDWFSIENIQNDCYPESPARIVTYKGEDYSYQTIHNDDSLELAQIPITSSHSFFDVLVDDPQYEGLLIQLIQMNQDKKEKAV